jgi:pentatricopeptide repeat protein
MNAGLTKLISKLSGEGSYRKALELFRELPGLGIHYDCTIANAAISACARGGLCCSCLTASTGNLRFPSSLSPAPPPRGARGGFGLLQDCPVCFCIAC